VAGVYGQFVPDNLVKWLLEQKSTKPLAVKCLGGSCSARLVDNLEKGDVIAYFHPMGHYTHCALDLGESKIACHTYCRSHQPECTWDNDWMLGLNEGFAYTLIHIR
jgi:hypothetical protein